MENITTYLTSAETAKLIRARLKKDFPGVKFSVRSGDCIWINWVDGPTKKAVDAVTHEYEAASHAKYVFATRAESVELNTKLVNQFCEQFGIDRALFEVIATERGDSYVKGPKNIPGLSTPTKDYIDRSRSRLTAEIG